MSITEHRSHRPTRSTRHRSTLPLVIGREHERAVLAAARDEAAGGAARLIVLSGEPGAGLTTLAHLCQAEATAAGFTAVWAAGWPVPGAAPMRPWDDIVARLGRAPVAAEGDVFARFQQFASAIEGALRGPLVVVLDDVHLTDPDTVHLARFLVRALRNKPLLVVLTAHDVGVDLPPLLESALEQAQRDGVLARVGGLGAADLERWVGDTGRWVGSSEVLHRLTGGNPQLVREVMAAGTSPADATAAGVHRLLRRRFARFQPAELEALGAVAVLDEATPGQAAAVIEQPVDAVRRGLRRAAAAGLVHGTATVTMAHGLLRAALLDELGDGAVAQLRLRAADLLVEADGLVPSPATLLRAAGLRLRAAEHLGDDAWDVAIDAVTAVARLDPLRALTCERADLVRTAIRLLEAAARPVPVELQLAMGHAEHAAGRIAAACAAFERAAADATDDPVSRAIAVAGLGALNVHMHRGPADVARFRAQLDAAIDAVGDTSPSLAVRLAARRAAEDWFAGRGTPEEVAAIVARLPADAHIDDRVETLSLLHHVLMGPQHANDRWAIADQLLELSARSTEAHLALAGPLCHTVDLVLAGDDAAPRAVRDLRQRAEALGMHQVSWTAGLMEAMLTTRDGDLDEAEQLATAAFELGARLGQDDAPGYFGGQLMIVRWLQGRIGEIVDIARDLVDMPTLLAGDQLYVAGLAAIAAHAGPDHHDDALHALARLRHRGLASIPMSSNWLVTIACTVEAACIVGDRELAAEGAALLAPFAHLPVMGSDGSVCLGPVSRLLALEARLRGDIAAARDLFHHALADARRLGDRPMTERLVTELDELAAHPVSPGTWTLRQAGRVWQLDAGGERAELRDAAGLRHLAMLLARPGDEIPAAALAGTQVSAAAHAVLDDDTIRAYRRRIESLSIELDRADLAGDVARSARVQAELDELVEHLGVATRADGRSREFADADERARTAVQKAIKRVLERLEDAAPRLAEHLTSSLRTGVVCCYEPPAGTPAWTVDLA